MRTTRLLPLLLLCSVVPVARAQAQEGPRGPGLIIGKVIDSVGRAVPHARVYGIEVSEYDMAQTPLFRYVTTDQSGEFRIGNLWPGDYDVYSTPSHPKYTPSVDAQKGGKGTEITVDPKSSSNTMAFSLAVWMIYSGVREMWSKEEFKRHFPQESQYRHSLAEESDALSQAAKMLPQGVKADNMDDPNLALLRRLSDTNMIEPYVLLNAADQGIAQDYVAYRAQNRSRLEQYLSQFVVPPTPVKP